MDDIGNMIGDYLGLGFLDNFGQGTATCGKYGYPTRQEDEDGYFSEGVGFVGR